MTRKERFKPGNLVYSNFSNSIYLVLNFEGGNKHAQTLTVMRVWFGAEPLPQSEGIMKFRAESVLERLTLWEREV